MVACTCSPNYPEAEAGELLEPGRQRFQELRLKKKKNKTEVPGPQSQKY